MELLPPHSIHHPEPPHDPAHRRQAIHDTLDRLVQRLTDAGSASAPSEAGPCGRPDPTP
ncbi:hypothetical protein AB0K08_12500 [Citricoccus sp. NPDC055426]|uniref:hypothetical protein n=1 Tax=Citricoccus sp. NPDC055426 TaxID=3155536 RepID=UPI003444BBAF